MWIANISNIKLDVSPNQGNHIPSFSMGFWWSPFLRHSFTCLHGVYKEILVFYGLVNYLSSGIYTSDTQTWYTFECLCTLMPFGTSTNRCYRFLETSKVQYSVSHQFVNWPRFVDLLTVNFPKILPEKLWYMSFFTPEAPAVQVSNTGTPCRWNAYNNLIQRNFQKWGHGARARTIWTLTSVDCLRPNISDQSFLNAVVTNSSLAYNTEILSWG